jgi:hypothetical protein
MLAGLALYLPVALAVFEPGIGIGMEYTDNVRLTPNNEDDELIVLGYAGASLDEQSGPWRANGAASFTYENYTDNTFSDQHYFDLNATAGWEAVPDRVDVIVRDFFTQRLKNSLDRSTPGNIENVNIFNLAPNIAWPLSRVQRVVITPQFSDFYYEDSNTDNQRYSLNADYLHDTSETNTLGVGGAISETDYENDDANSDFSATNLHALATGQFSHSKYKLNLGYSWLDRDNVEDQDGVVGSLGWVYGITGRSDAKLYVASDLTSSSYTALESAIDPDTGDINNVQISGDVIRNNVMRATYVRKGRTLTSSLFGELRDLDYKESPQDREVQGGGIRIRYQARALLSTGLYARYTRTKQTDIDRTDKQYLVGGEIGYQLSRKLRAAFDLRYRDKNSTDEAQEYTEVSGLLSLVYGFGEIPGRKAPRGY